MMPAFEQCRVLTLTAALRGLREGHQEKYQSKRKVNELCVTRSQSLTLPPANSTSHPAGRSPVPRATLLSRKKTGHKASAKPHPSEDTGPPSSALLYKERLDRL